MIQFNDVSKTYETNVSESHALKNVNLTINDKEFVFILGASGAGKSTFLKLIMREEIPTKGDIIVDGKSLAKMPRRKVPYLRRRMGIVFQDFRLIEKMTVFDNVAFAMRVIGSPSKKIKKRVLYVLDLVGLKHKAASFPSELSGGEKQRVSLARALVNAPNIIIADEPTGNIDPEMSIEIMTLLSEINKNGTTVLVVTHEHELVQQFGGRVIVLDDGSVVSDSGNLGGAV
ncbi:MAG: cell division ATP-binding protein FtsE [Clostridiales bacterium]|nr:cell division ATP-binding protein FtsE [Clostridiales bacterium]